VGFPGGPRLEWYDRNPIERAISYTNDAVGPHGFTTRASYTVPAGKKAIVHTGFAQITRNGAPTTADKATIYLTLASGETIRLSLRSATIGATEHAEISPFALAKAGTVISIATSDVSTGGTHCMDALITLTEIDA